MGCLLLFMIGKLSLLILLVAITRAGWTNNTDFWTNQMKSNLTFEAYSGHEEIDWYYPANTSGMHYHLYSAHSRTVKEGSTTIPLFLWLQGGPGSSSMFGAFTENGPILIKNGKASDNHWGWNLIGHMLFVDSPLNVGFSFGPGDRTGDKQVNSANMSAEHLVNFLHKFYLTWPQLKQNPLYLTGESFAGHYLPSLARQILQNETKLKFNLAGVSIGDGWTDPLNQVNFYDTYLWSVGVIANKFRDVCNWYQTHSILNIYEKNFQNATNFFDFLTNNDTTPQVYMNNISIFNFRNYDGIDTSFAKFLTDNRQAMGINTSLEFISGNDKIYTAFGPDISKSYADDVAYVVGKVKTLIYNGQNDVVVNTPGVLQYLNGLTWNGARQWKKTQKKIWKIDGHVSGWAKVSDNLWFVLVNGAGHMVPSDQPVRALVMIGRFVNNLRDWDL